MNQSLKRYIILLVYARMLIAIKLFSQFGEQEIVLNFHLMYFCGKVQPLLTPAGTAGLTQCDREIEMTARLCLIPLPRCPRFAKNPEPCRTGEFTKCWLVLLPGDASLSAKSKRTTWWSKDYKVQLKANCTKDIKVETRNPKVHQGLFPTSNTTFYLALCLVT